MGFFHRRKERRLPECCAGCPYREKYAKAAQERDMARDMVRRLLEREDLYSRRLRELAAVNDELAAKLYMKTGIKEEKKHGI